MTTDRELLELAAKAAGITGIWSDEHGKFLSVKRDMLGDFWNPLDSDADAFRLVVKLGIDVCMGSDMLYTQTTLAPTPMFKEKFGTNPYAATRRAITRAAAEIGRGMP